MKKNQEGNPLITEAHKAADLMYAKHDLDKKERTIYDVMSILNLEGYGEKFETFTNCSGLLTEVACLLTNPEISNLMKDNYYKKNGGKLILAMISFFDRLADNPDMEKMLAYGRFKYLAGKVDEDDLKDFSASYLEE